MGRCGYPPEFRRRVLDLLAAGDGSPNRSDPRTGLIGQPSADCLEALPQRAFAKGC